MHEPPSPSEETTTEEERRQEQAKGQEPNTLGTSYYQQKYKHLLGGLECAKESAVKMEPNKKFGYGECGMWFGNGITMCLVSFLCCSTMHMYCCNWYS